VGLHRIRRFVGLGASGVAFACLGAATAFALEPPPLPPLPTTTSVSVSVPTLPVPVPTVPLPTVPLPTTSTTLPAPLPPPPTLPAPTPTTSTPAVTGVTGVTGGTGGTGGTAPTAPTAGAISTRDGGGTDSSIGGSTSPGSYGGTPGDTARSRSGIWISRIGVAPAPGRRGVVAVRFALARSSRVIVVLRGPLPDCARIARFGIGGHIGTNTFQFTGRVGKRKLPSGTYLIGVRPRSAETMKWIAARVGPRGARALPRRVVGPALARCAAQNSAAMYRLDGAGAGALPRTSGPATTTGGTRGEQSPAPAPPPIEVLPFDAIEEAVSELPAWLAYLVLAIVAASLATIIVVVVKFVRATPGGSAGTE
jgi:hypothetical protein